VSDDPIGDALRADAEQALAEIRAAGISCPSCGVNMADLPQDHRLVLTNEPHPDLREGLSAAYAECRDGQRVSLLGASLKTLKAAANVSLLDDMRAAEDAAFSKLTGFGAQGESP